MTFHSAHGVGRCQPSAGTPATAARSMARASSRTSQPVKVISLMICRAAPPSGGLRFLPYVWVVTGMILICRALGALSDELLQLGGAPCSLARRGSPNATANEQASSPAVASAVHSAALR